MLLDDRLAQIVPTLTPTQIQFALRFASGPERRFAPDEKLLDVGDRDMAGWSSRGASLRADGMVWAGKGYLPPADRVSSAEK